MKTTWLIGCVCKSGDTFSLAVLIDRGLDLQIRRMLRTFFGGRRCDARHHSRSSLTHSFLVPLFSSQGLVKASPNELVLMTVRVHLFPSRTQQLSSLVPTILGWKRPGKIGRRQHKRQPPRRNPWRFVFFFVFCVSYRLLQTANLNTELNCGNMAHFVPYSSRGNESQRSVLCWSHGERHR